MSRTFRKHSQTFEEYYKSWLVGVEHCTFGICIRSDETWVIEYLRKENYKYKTKTQPFYDWHGIPKAFRKIVNRTRRRMSKHEVWKSINFNDYPEQCSKWNCKDNDHWSYY